MYKITMTFKLKKPADSDAVHDVWRVLSEYSASGQLLGDYLVTRDSSGKSIRVTGVAHERSAFSQRYGSRDLGKALTRLKRRLRAPVRRDWERFAEDPKTCDCAKPSRLLFSPHLQLEASPFRCLDCRGRRPEYRLRNRVRTDSCRNLARQCHGFYWIWMDSGETEALAWRQLADPESEMSRMVKKQLRDLEKRIGIPVYYDLPAHYVSKLEDSPETRPCPGCGRPWTVESDPALTCVRCRLFSYTPVDGRPPGWWRPLPRHRRATRP
ncbi:MAG TPA: DUF2310 family Zn-ribbon-containing protein [Planctomycetota bacterium]|nr:DUF2310 family Zn-ribbon-containing protein [Planctomycetota bacterium]